MKMAIIVYTGGSDIYDRSYPYDDLPEKGTGHAMRFWKMNA